MATASASAASAPAITAPADAGAPYGRSGPWPHGPRHDGLLDRVGRIFSDGQAELRGHQQRDPPRLPQFQRGDRILVDEGMLHRCRIGGMAAEHLGQLAVQAQEAVGQVTGIRMADAVRDMAQPWRPPRRSRPSRGCATPDRSRSPHRLPRAFSEGLARSGNIGQQDDGPARMGTMQVQKPTFCTSDATASRHDAEIHGFFVKAAMHGMQGRHDFALACFAHAAPLISNAEGETARKQAVYVRIESCRPLRRPVRPPSARRPPTRRSVRQQRSGLAQDLERRPRDAQGALQPVGPRTGRLSACARGDIEHIGG